MDVNAAADQLFAMRTDQRIEADLSPGNRPADLAEAYAVQEALVARLLTGPSDRTIGYKVACTNRIAQEALAIDRPVYGQLLASTTHDGAERVELVAAEFTTRVMEPEFGIVIGETVPSGSGPHTAESIAPYIETVVPSLEVVDHRFVDWSVGALSVAADNAIHGCWVPGLPFSGDWRDLDLATHPVRALVGDKVVTTGDGSAVLGHPLNVVAWLADELPGFGRALQAGDRITTGVATDVFTADASDVVTADFGPLGQVTVAWI